jgi:hypothetical protein
VRTRHILILAAMTVLLSLLAASVAIAAPGGPPDYGVMEPRGLADKGCPWPTAENDDPIHADAQKCLPQSIPWSEVEHEGVISSGVRIISDGMIGTTALPDATGQVTFRCQSRVGLQYKVTAQGLTARTTYTVMALQLGPAPSPIVLGAFTTDTRGNGILNGTLHLPKGGYGFMFFVLDGDVPVLVMDPSDPVVGIAVL